MLLAVDIGNTNITFGVFKKNRIVKRFNIPTSRYNKKALSVFLSPVIPQVKDNIICSVVPKITGCLRKDLKSLFLRQPLIVGEDVFVPIRNLYHLPSQVGQDRLVNAFAGCAIYGQPLIIVDYGTAITFDVISKKGEYLGGMILPGLQVALESLHERTALLPRVKLTPPRKLIGRTTRESIQSGIVYGFGALTDGLIGRIKKQFPSNTRVIGTGGNIRLMRRYCRSFNGIDENITLKGLYLLFASLKNKN
ncbi:MAG: type III pantothenate kinase [Candidatus Omnitrophota bacterium]